MEMSEWIDRALTRRGRNAVVDLARALDVDKSAVTRIRKGERKVSGKELQRIEAFFGQKAPRQVPDDDDSDREQAEWIEQNQLDMIPVDAQGAVQQKALNFLAFNTRKIAAALERIAALLERREQQQSNEADRRPEGKASRNRD